MTVTSVEQFAEVARKYCAWSESDFGEPIQEMKTAQKLLAELHFKILDLETPDCEDVEEKDISSDDWKKVWGRFSKMPIQNYWEVFNPFNVESEEPVISMLDDDLSDIYRDLKRGLVIYENGQRDVAEWEWKFSFIIHWGMHLTDAQKAIHIYLSDNGEL